MAPNEPAMTAMDKSIASNAPEHLPTMPSLYNDHDNAATARSPSDQDEAIPKHRDGDDDAASKPKTTFFRLPREIRDQIYHLCLPNLAAIHVNHAPSMAVQPAISKVCGQIRQEFLELFYKRMNFFIAYRFGAIGSHLSPHATAPVEVLERWITAIGDEHIKMIRYLSFNHWTFSVNVRVAISESGVQSLVLKFRLLSHHYNSWDKFYGRYNIFVAAERAERGLQYLIDDLQAGVAKNGLSVDSVKKIGRAIESVQPFLCPTAWPDGADFVLPKDSPISSWPCTESHSKNCHRCSGGGEPRGLKRRFSSV